MNTFLLIVAVLYLLVGLLVASFGIGYGIQPYREAAKTKRDKINVVIGTVLGLVTITLFYPFILAWNLGKEAHKKRVDQREKEEALAKAWIKFKEEHPIK